MAGYESIGWLSDVTGIGRETVARKIRPLEYKNGPRGAKLYYTPEALPLIYVVEGAKRMDLAEARTVLATKQAAKIDLDMELKKGDFVPREAALEGIINVLTAFKAKLLAIPTKAVAQLRSAKNDVEREALFTELMEDACKELVIPPVLARPDATRNKGAAAGGVPGDGASTEADDKRVG